MTLPICANCFTKRGTRPSRRAHHVLPDQHLTGRHCRRTDADSRHRAHGLIHAARNLRGHHLHEHAERAGLSQSNGIRKDALGGLAATLHAEAAQGVLRLRGETNMRHHRNTGTHQGANPLVIEGIRLNLDRRARRPPS